MEGGDREESHIVEAHRGYVWKPRGAMCGVAWRGRVSVVARDMFLEVSGLSLACIAHAVRRVRTRVMRWASVSPRPGAGGECQASVKRGALLEIHVYADLMIAA